MKTWFAAVAVVALSLAVAPDASAQVVVSRTWSSAPLIGGPVYDSTAYVYPYSYYAVFPWPARGYVPYGPTDEFAFHGQAYGHPYDRWTWPYMGGGYYRSLARYYYPPVP